MQKQTYLDDLKFIVESINIEKEDQINFRGEPYKGHDYPETSREILLSYNLSKLIYFSCYTRNHQFDQQNIFTPESNDLFLSKLQKANCSSECFNCGWTVKEIEYRGNILVEKSGYKRYAYAGNFLRENFVQGPIQRGELINIRVLPDYGFDAETMGQFYFVFGKTLLDDDNSAKVRLYFNLKPEGAISLVEWISNNLNHYNIPFNFKCLKQPSFYTRCDSGVLYINKRYLGIVLNLLIESYHLIKTWLNIEVPMFTRLLTQGIGFAENPPSPNESFGTNRSKIVAKGIIDAWKEKHPKAVWLDSILHNIKNNFFNPETLYLNPNSKYPYRFPDF